MTRFGWTVVVGCLVAAAAVALLIWGFSRQSPSSEPEPVPQDTEIDPSALSIYTSGTYGFSFFYPNTATLNDSFENASSAPAWRANASTPGARIVEVALGAREARVGMSDDADAVAACTEPAPAETVREPRTIGETSWSVFVADELGTENERRITSYRTVHEGACFALETIVPLDAGHAQATASSTDLGLIIQSFTFAR